MEQLYLILNKIILQILNAYYFARFPYLPFNNLKISIHKIKSPTRKLKGFFLVSVSCYDIYSNESIVFSGMDQSLYLAYKKSISEYLESYISNKILHINTNNSRNGLAVHIDKMHTEQKARLELIERDSFLMHFLCPSLKTQKLLDYITSDLKIHCIKLQTDEKYNVILTSIENLKSKSQFIGLGCELTNNKNSLSIAIQSSYQEALMLNHYWTLPKFTQSSHRPKQKTLQRHLQALTKIDIKNNIETMLNGGGLATINFNIGDIEFNSLKYQYEDFYFCQAVNQNLIQLKFDNDWIAGKDQYSRILLQRGLSIEFWDYHPLL